MRKIVSGIMLILLLTSVLFVMLYVPVVVASGTVYIMADGSIDPPTAPISSTDNITYTFTDNIYDEIVVERDNIIIDGAGYTVQGSGGGDGFYWSGINNVTIKNTNIKDFSCGVYLDSSSNNNTVSQNNITNNGEGVYLDWECGGNNIISGNNITNSGCGVHFYWLSEGNNIVSGNIITDSSFYGVCLEGSSNNIVSGNTITNGSYYGAWGYGVWVDWSSNNTVSGNIVTNFYYGVYLDWLSNNTVSGNTITNSFYDGIVFGNSDNNTIFENNVINNGYGIEFIHSSGNSIYHNNFNSNTCQVGGYNSVNSWDNSYPSGGNYWSDYIGTDFLRGACQNETGSDQIGDIPYVVDENNQDNYPLMKPWSLARSTRYAWPMFRHNLRHTGYTKSPAPTTNKTQWTYTTGSAVRSSPAVVDGVVFIGSNDSKVYALDQYAGAQVWNYTTGGWVQSSPAAVDGKVYTASFDGKVYCLDALTGASIWNYTTGGIVLSSPAVADGKVYVGSVDKKVYALNASTGSLIWSYTTGNPVYSSPAVADGKVYIGSNDNKVYCLDALTGDFVWSYAALDDVETSPAVADGKVYVGSDDGKVYCLDALTGASIWNYTTGRDVHSSPAVVDGKVYVGSDDNKTYCLEASTGNLVWIYITGGWVQSSPAVADGKVYTASFDGKVYCLDSSTGDFIWGYTTGNDVWSSPAVADGMVFIGSGDRAIYAFGDVIRVPEDYPTVQGAINNATAGATISIAPGVYHESVIVNKPLTILGRKGSAPTFVGGGSGIAFTLQPGASGSIIAGIVITNYSQGIFIDGASNCKIYDNIMTLNVNSGIAQGNSAANNLIYSNIFQQNPGVAINLTQHSISNTIYSNTFILNSIGLTIASGSNTIYWNIFIDNTDQAHVEDPVHNTNTWDNGYPDGGNYWSNHPCVDLFSGPLQNGVGSDGINDTQCTIAANNIDRYPLVKPFNPHDIGIISVTTSKTLIGQGLTLRLDVKILNYGIHNEHFAVAVYANTTIITTFADFALTSRNSTTITIEWNTTGFAKGNYTINVEVPPVADETDTLDNTFTDGTVKIGVPGDLNNDNLCDLLDLVKVAGKFGKVLGELGFDPNYDINDDTFIDLLDLVKVAIHFGETDP